MDIPGLRVVAPDVAGGDKPWIVGCDTPNGFEPLGQVAFYEFAGGIVCDMVAEHDTPSLDIEAELRGVTVDAIQAEQKRQGASNACGNGDAICADPDVGYHSVECYTSTPDNGNGGDA